MLPTAPIPGALPVAMPAASGLSVRQADALARPSASGLDGAARQFEQLLVRQLLSQLRRASLDGNADAPRPSEGYLQLADDHLAATVAAVGGLGLAASARRWMQGMQAYRTDAAAVPGAPG